ncbi:MAG: ribonuclease J [Candidatus Rokubacteria bacterium]|nr:ribonuclease J [Candidatus Rokubacteria bacterium]
MVLTHGHEDHIGALPYLLREVHAPVYGTPLTLALAGERLREHGLLEEADLRPMRPRERLEIGAFTVEPIRVTHSIVDGMGLAIRTPAGTVVHTGDFKLDPSPLDGELADVARFAELGAEGVLVLCSDSTNVDRPGHTRSEVEVGHALAERFRGAPGRIIVATFASHIHRIQQVLDLTARHGRRAALLGMSM